MAYNTKNEVRVELFDIKKNSRGDHVKGAKITNTNTNTESIDIRQFFTNDDDEVIGTSKGVRFNSENLMEVLTGLIGALDVTELQTLSDTINEKLNEAESED